MVSQPSASNVPGLSSVRRITAVKAARAWPGDTPSGHCRFSASCANRWNAPQRYASDRPIAGKLSGSLQGKLFHQTRSLYLARDVPSTGMTFLYVTPALNYEAPGGVSVYGYLQLPAYRYVNDMQLAPRAAVLTGLAKTF